MKALLLSLLISSHAFGAAVIFSGSNVKALKQNLDLNGIVTIQSGSVNPSSSATSANAGSLYLSTSQNACYVKQDSGSSTNWTKMGSIGSLNSQTGYTQVFANDTNVIVTSSNNTHTLGWAGTLSIARGGTNNGSLGPVLGGIVYSDASKLNILAAGTAGQLLTANGAGAPSWGLYGVTTGSGNTANMWVGSSTPAGLTSGTGDFCLGAGNSCSAMTSAADNTCVGVATCSNYNTTSYNTALGWRAGAHRTGNQNTDIGDEASTLATSGDKNTFVGATSGPQANSATGDSNALVGFSAGYNLNAGARNSGVGYYACIGSTSASDSVCVGYQSGLTPATGNGRNVFLGSGADGTASTTTNAVAVGYNQTAASNQAIFGNSTENTSVMGATPKSNGALTLPAGTTSTAPLFLQAGTNLTSASAGAMEWDGTMRAPTFTDSGGTRVKLLGTSAAYAAGGLPYYSDSVTVATLTAGTSGQVITSAGAGAPTWGLISLTSQISGTLPIANGGTNNGSLSTVLGGIVYSDATKLNTLAAGTSGQILTSGGAASPTWSSLTTSLSTDWKNDLSWTYTGAGTVGTHVEYYKRIGDTMMVKGYVTSGTPTATCGYINLPAGLTIDSTKLTNATRVQTVGYAHQLAGTGDAWAGGATTPGNASGLIVVYDGSTTSGVTLQYRVASGGTPCDNASAWWGPSTIVSFEFEVPITQWAGAAQTYVQNALSIHGSRITCGSSGSGVVAATGTDSSWISSVTNGATGVCTVNFAASKFSQEPACTCSIIATASLLAQTCEVTSNASTSSISLQRNAAGAATNGDVYLTCLGAP